MLMVWKLLPEGRERRSDQRSSHRGRAGCRDRAQADAPDRHAGRSGRRAQEVSRNGSISDEIAATLQDPRAKGRRPLNGPLPGPTIAATPDASRSAVIPQVWGGDPTPSSPAPAGLLAARDPVQGSRTQVQHLVHLRKMAARAAVFMCQTAPPQGSISSLTAPLKLSWSQG